MISREVFSAGSGEIIASAPDIRSFREAAVDSRAVHTGDIFVALKGEQTDGHLYIPQALEKGAAGLVMNKDFYREHPETAEMLHDRPDLAVQLADDPLTALQNMARFHMSTLPASLLKIGITGSNGKTTTKELIGAVVSKWGSAFINKGNLNSDIGLCQEVLRCSGREKTAVFEMGMNRIGEIELLTEIVGPDIGVITNIGTAHIGLLGSVENIAAEKKMIFSRFTGRKGETGFLHEDEPFFEYLQKDVAGKILPYGRRTAGVTETDLGLKGSEIVFGEGTVRFPLIGEYNRKNMYAAYEVGRFLGLHFGEVRDALEDVKPLFGRGEIIEGNATIILDCYNANEDSMRAVLQLAAGLSWKGRKIAVLGDLRELGAYEDEIHIRMGSYAAGLSFDYICFYGELMRRAYESASASFSGSADSAGDRLFWSGDMDELSGHVKKLVRTGDLLLLKGSRSIELERVYHHIRGGKYKQQYKENIVC